MTVLKDPELVNSEVSTLDELQLEVSASSADTKTANLASELGINHKKLIVNISNANVYGMASELKLTGNQYNTALTLFFVPYIFFEVFGNYCIKFVKPHIWLSGSVFLFGAITVGMGFVKNFGALAATRFLLGIVESVLFCGIFYVLSTFYTMRESQRRFSAFFSCTALAGAASGAIAYRVDSLDGLHGYSSWRWIFILEGCATIIGSFVLFYILTDFPEQARFLSTKEKHFLKQKLEWYAGASVAYEITNTWRDVVKCLKDWLIWLPSLSYFGLIIPSYGYAYFAATIINQMGYTAVSAQQHSVYPWVCAFGVINIVAFASDYFKKRLPFLIGAMVIAIVGLAMILGATDKPQVRYGGCFLAASGLYTAMPLIVCWAALNNGSHLRKSVGTAWQIGFGNIGGIIATFIFLSKDAPVYKPGLSTCLAAVCFAMLTGVAYFFYCLHMNKIKQTDAYKQKFNELPEREQVNLGDRNPNFVYLY
ncbi:TNA1 [Candida metapsilosis]|uniref:TNA1 n=1 Tax=Candida metapsilosis TaxID=273372 RepID=A0A8H7Z9Q1_9ASCO|nr:TNA1 [Candida metapsilosis]